MCLSDTKLLMNVEISSLAGEASWRLATMLRTRRFFNDVELARHYKAHVLSFIEYRTAAVYHAATSVLAPLDAVQERMLRAANMTAIEALVHCKLAPLSCRLDMGMLGVIHRAVLGRGPSQLRALFQRTDAAPGRHTRLSGAKHRLQLEEFNGEQDYIKRSLLGLIKNTTTCLLAWLEGVQR